MRLLYYCPESNYYYDDHNIIKAMVTQWSRKEVLQQVKLLIKKASMMSVDGISEKNSSQEASVSVSIDVKSIEPAA